jgi:hypothetical protein
MAIGNHSSGVVSPLCSLVTLRAWMNAPSHRQFFFSLPYEPYFPSCMLKNMNVDIPPYIERHTSHRSVLLHLLYSIIFVPLACSIPPSDKLCSYISTASVFILMRLPFGAPGCEKRAWYILYRHLCVLRPLQMCYPLLFAQ